MSKKAAAIMRENEPLRMPREREFINQSLV
jgi:hypothetical protein